MRTVPLFYFTHVKNVGDQVNLDLVKGLFGLEPSLCSQEQQHLLGVGSIMSFGNENSLVWGTGIVHPSVPVPAIPPRQIHALRGKLTVQAMRAAGLAAPDVPLGDPAFLASRLMTERPEKEHRLGIAAHYVDRSHPWVGRMLKDPDVLDLNVHDDPAEFLFRMAKCEAVVSSSLHGLVFAEALGIPNLWMQLSDKVHGAGFKFRDWFSLAANPQNEPALPHDTDSTESIAARAELHGMQIDEDALIDRFPFANP